MVFCADLHIFLSHHPLLLYASFNCVKRHLYYFTLQLPLLTGNNTKSPATMKKVNIYSGHTQVRYHSYKILIFLKFKYKLGPKIIHGVAGSSKRALNHGRPSLAPAYVRMQTTAPVAASYASRVQSRTGVAQTH